MRYLFELSGEHPDLPLYEAESLLSGTGEVQLIERDSTAAIFESDMKPDDFVTRIALSHVLCEHIASVDIDDLESVFEERDLSDARSAAIGMKTTGERRDSLDTRKLTRQLGAILAQKTKIDLESPDVQFRVFIGKRVHIGKEIAGIDRSQYEKRKNRYLPFVSPISIHPRLARALINITARTTNCALIDPFCGTGALLIESSLMGMETYGSDISEKMIQGSERNLRSFGLAARLKRLDVGEINQFGMRFDCIVTDPPYGRSASTNREPIKQLYSRALEAFSENLAKYGRVGIIVPDLEALDYEGDFRMLRRTSIRVHRSLVRNFWVLELR